MKSTVQKNKPAARKSKTADSSKWEVGDIIIDREYGVVGRINDIKQDKTRCARGVECESEPYAVIGWQTNQKILPPSTSSTLRNLTRKKEKGDLVVYKSQSTATSGKKTKAASVKKTTTAKNATNKKNDKKPTSVKKNRLKNETKGRKQSKAKKAADKSGK